MHSTAHPVDDAVASRRTAARHALTRKEGFTDTPGS
jgi:hypothetical protein